MIKEVKDIDSFGFLITLIATLQAIKQLSWTIDQTQKRYPTPEAMTEEEMKSATKIYLALGFELEQRYKEWKELYEEYKSKDT